MALTSPGVEVTIIDESQYLPGAPASVPFFLLATAQDKADPTGTGIAAATTAANANKLYRITSQRDLVTLYGNPFFYTTTNGTPIQGYELNEYGLLAAYSALGVSNQVFCLRADIDLASLVGSTGRPTGAPEDDSYWLDSTTSTWGINEFNATTGSFTPKNPIVITDSDLLSAGAPLGSVGNIGDYAVVAIANYNYPSASTAPVYFYKAPTNTWVALGSEEWFKAWPALLGNNSNPTLTAGDTFDLALNGTNIATITVQAAPNNTISQVAADINALNWKYLFAAVQDNKLAIYSAQTGGDNPSTYFVRVLNGTGTVLADLGFAATTTGFQPKVFYGTSAQQPLWQAGQSNPAPTGSIWVKVGTAGNGLNPAISQYDSLSASFVPKIQTFASSDWAQIVTVDSTGGQAIPAGSVYTQYGYDGEYNASPLYYWYRSGTGPTAIKGTNTAPDFTNGPYSARIQVSTPGSASLSSAYNFFLADNSDATDFVTAWSAANVPYTSAQVNDDGSITITHTAGGVIVLDDFDTSTGLSQDLWSEAGFVANTTAGAKYGPAKNDVVFQPIQSSTTGAGINLQVSVTNDYQNYDFSAGVVVAGGSGHAVGDRVVFSGTDLGGSSPANDLTVTVTSVDGAGSVTSWTWFSGEGAPSYTVQLSNWRAFSLTTTGANSLISNEGEPTSIPDNLTNWFYSTVDQVDIMINFNGAWKGYKNQGYDANGLPSPSILNSTDPAGPIVSASEPTVQSDGTALAYGDLWIDTTDLENYPVINRWQQVEGVDKWVRIDNTDQINPSGIVFADARWATNGTTNPANDPIPSITALLASDYLDIDAPNDALYPVGMLLFNTRRSGYNVKQYRVNWFNADRFPNSGSLPTQKDAWVSASGLQSNGAPYMGRKAQRAMVVQAMRAALDTNTAIRDEDNFFNLQAAPNYPELQPNMVVLNSDRGETSYIVGDTPMRLADSATEIQAWATNAAGATSTGEDGCVTRNTYLGLFYPSGITTDLSGNLVAVPSSHMMIRTMLRNDQIAYPWLAPAGTRRGIIDNATNIGYIDAQSGEFQTIRTRVGIRDVLYTNFINPLVFFTGNGLLNYGNKTSFDSQSALDRINVARLVAYIRRQLTIAARPFVFEPNDTATRTSIKAVIETLFQDLVSKRGLYDYSVVCDSSNNTPARIDRNELWIDIAVEPVKAAEFIYIPVRIFNTGELSGGGA